jgi:putative effector of murein hydrolase
MLGITCHTFGVVRALEIGPLAAAYATVGMIVVGLLYAFAVPWVLLLAGLA